MRYWCLSTSIDNWKVCKENNLWGMDYRYYPTLAKFVNPGDKAVIYTSKNKRFVATVKFTGSYFYDDSDIGWNYLFPYRINFEILHENEKSPQINYTVSNDGNEANWFGDNLIDEISFIADKSRTWNQYFQVSIIRITEEDFNTIQNVIINQ
ncbi:protein of unknown function DUF55 [Methanohalobium evestigatum Z-7303]|uniref:EVE domain-containing protein n=1 Tax=Methanohalobium evestigatum (strain ATCC BAA-1072 / DSM 3721 / NBRC 107634 / OCM 161 / Z-7303) TaxID=644295 RepID=D7E6N8_METEZ|nr:EVE domain-containing protein [Methanohalobium evestigatum]ADI73260.1 protein of unknown function DUF55 [Methanohalobium evestigatum Z-7303]